MNRILLVAGIGSALLYFVTLVVASLTWPGYSQVSQYASELGSADAPFPMIFNAGIVTTGALGILGGLGVFLCMARLGRPLSGFLAGTALAAWGVGMVLGGLHPMPDPRHHGYGLVMGVVLLPAFLMIALRGRASTGEYIFLVAWLCAIAVLLGIMFGVGGLVTTANVGLWQRGLALAMIPGIGIACARLLKRSA